MAVLRVPTYNVLPFIVLRVPAYNVLSTKGNYRTKVQSQCCVYQPTMYTHIKLQWNSVASTNLQCTPKDIIQNITMSYICTQVCFIPNSMNISNLDFVQASWCDSAAYHTPTRTFSCTGRKGIVNLQGDHHHVWELYPGMFRIKF